jgi:hypothetical protein
LSANSNPGQSQNTKIIASKALKSGSVLSPKYQNKILFFLNPKTPDDPRFENLA